MLILDVLFQRSKLFRGLLIPKLEALFELVVGLNNPLPPPKESARTLHKRSLEVIETWNRDFGQYNRQVKRVLDFTRWQCELARFTFSFVILSLGLHSQLTVGRVSA